MLQLRVESMQKLYYEKFTENQISLGEVYKEHIYVEGVRNQNCGLQIKSEIIGYRSGTGVHRIAHSKGL